MDPKIEETDVQCVCCNGNLIRQTELICNVPAELVVIGPGGEGQWSEKEEIYCKDCGLFYHHLPEIYEEE